MEPERGAVSGGRHAHGQVTTEVVDDRILVMTVDRVEKKNAFTPKISGELASAYTRLDEDRALFAGVLTFAGDHATAGLEMPLYFGPDAEARQPAGSVDPFGLQRRLTKPLVTAVQGITFTVGIEIALAGDIVVAASDTRFCQLEPKRGLAPLGGATIRYVQRAGWGNAMYHLLRADEFGAGPPHLYAIFEENNRLMVLVSINCDTSDSWEREGDNPGYFQRFSPMGYALGVNIAIWVLSH